MAKELPEELMELVSKIAQGTTAFEVLCAFFLTVLKRNNGNRMATSRELKIPVRTLRHRIWYLVGQGYDVPEPIGHMGGYTKFLQSRGKASPKKHKLHEF